MPTYPDAQALDVAPAAFDTPLFRLSLTVADAFIALPSGGYLATLEDASGAQGCIVCIGQVAADPASGASAQGSLVIPPGGSDVIWLDAPLDVHALMRAGTGELYLAKRQ